MRASSIIDVILGEATAGTRAERFDDMVAIASAITNRSTTTNTPAEQVVAAKDSKGNPQFDAYGRSLPSGVEAYRSLAEEAWSYVQNFGPTHQGAFYGRPGADLGIKGLQTVDQTKGHNFYSDPQGRSILVGDNKYVTPTQAAALPQTAPVPAAVAAYGPPITAPVSLPYSDLVTPASVRSTTIDPYAASLPSIAPTPTPAPSVPSVPSTSGLGMAALAPNGLIGQNIAPPTGAGRSEMPNASLINALDASVKSVFGPEYSISLTSGTYSPSKQASLAEAVAGLEARGINPDSKEGKSYLQSEFGQVGTTRHNQGLAVDFSIVNTQTGVHATRNNTDPNAFRTFEQEAAARGVTGMGFGKGYMDRDGVARYHMDFEKDSVWGRDANQLAQSKAFGRDLGPLPSWDTHPQGLPTPTSRDEALMGLASEAAFGALPGVPDVPAAQAANSAMGMVPGLGDLPGAPAPFSAPLGEVERAALPDIVSAVDPVAAPSLAQGAVPGLGDVPAVVDMPSVAETVFSQPSDAYTSGLAELSGITQGFGNAGLAPSIATAPAVDRSSLTDVPSVTPAPSVPSTSSIADAYAGLASSMTAAGVSGLGHVPSVPSVPTATDSLFSASLTAPAQTISSPATSAAPSVPSSSFAVSLPDIAPTPTRAPEPPNSTPADSKSNLGSRLGGAALGAAIGGVPGALIGALAGPTISNVGKGLASGIGSSLGIGSFENPSMPESTFSVGRGLDAIDGVFSGSFGVGATAFSTGNPAVSFTDLGNGNVAKTNSELGTTSIVNANSFNWGGGSQKSSPSTASSSSSWGLGDIFGGLGDSISDAFSGWGGDWSGSSSDDDYGSFSPT